MNPTDCNLVEWLNAEVRDYLASKSEDLDHLGIYTLPVFWCEDERGYFEHFSTLPRIDYQRLKRLERRQRMFQFAVSVYFVALAIIICVTGKI
ncbi:MAG TPA: hypothetical protein VGS11_11900 [Candidatus Bathyarchaeia archaeon]|nr:hypothetical protein [Candidatus Bathyarchaeia archaeon]